MKLLIIVRKLPHKAAHSTQKDRLYPFMPIHNASSQAVHELLVNVHELGGNFFCKVPYVN